METRMLLLPDDLPSLLDVDTTSRSDAVLIVTASSAGFTLIEEPTEIPFIKTYNFVEELTTTEPAWDEGFVATDDGRVIGIVLTTFRSWNRRQVLWGLYVDLNHRRFGVGRSLVNLAYERGDHNGARQLWLETQNTNVPAIRAYRAMDFCLVGLDQTLYDGDVTDETALYFARPI